MARSSSEYNAERSEDTEEGADWETKVEHSGEHEEKRKLGPGGELSGEPEEAVGGNWELRSLENKRET
jgi:hypothetical protein